MRSPFALAPLLLPLLILGCKGNTLEGRWNATGLQNLPPSATVVFEFKGGQAVMTFDVKMNQFGEATIKADGPYKLEGETLTLTPSNVTFDDSKITDPKTKATIAQLGLKDQLQKGMKDPVTYTVKFDSSDQVLLTSKQITATLTRIK